MQGLSKLRVTLAISSNGLDVRVDVVLGPVCLRLAIFLTMSSTGTVEHVPLELVLEELEL